MLKSLRRCPTSLRWRLTHSPSPITTLRSLQTAEAGSPPSISIPFQVVRSIHEQQRRYASAATAPAAQADGDSVNERIINGPATKFAQLAEQGLVHPRVIGTLTQKMRLDTMTEVQSLTLNEALKHKDVYVPSHHHSYVER